jgi:hypothetical protein
MGALKITDAREDSAIRQSQFVGRYPVFSKETVCPMAPTALTPALSRKRERGRCTHG